MDLREHLQRQYREVAVRYATATGRQPPPLVADVTELQATVRTMLDVLRGHRETDAGPAVDVDEPEAIIGASGASVMVPMLDAEGRRAGMLTFALGRNEPCVRALLGELRALAKQRLG